MDRCGIDCYLVLSTAYLLVLTAVFWMLSQPTTGPIKSFSMFINSYYIKALNGFWLARHVGNRELIKKMYFKVFVEALIWMFFIHISERFLGWDYSAEWRWNRLWWHFWQSLIAFVYYLKAYVIFGCTCFSSSWFLRWDEKLTMSSLDLNQALYNRW